MLEKGIVKKIDADQVLVELTGLAQCQRCANRMLCLGKKRNQITACNPLGLTLAPGDRVEMNLPTGRTVFAAFMTMIMPLLTAAAGYLIAARLLLFNAESARALLAAAGLAAGFMITIIYGWISGKKNRPSIVAGGHGD